MLASAGAAGAGATAPVPVEARVDTHRQRAKWRLRHIPGLSLGVVRDGQLVFAKGYGEANVEWKAPATPETVYLLASLTKQFTATAIMMLVKDGRVALDDPLSKWVTGPSWAGITIRHLLTHTAGLKDRFEVTTDGRMLLDYSTAQMLEAATRDARRRATGREVPGTAIRATSCSALVVERASGQSLRRVPPAAHLRAGRHDVDVAARLAGDRPRPRRRLLAEGDKLIGSRRRYQFGLVSHYGVQSNVRDLARYDAALSAGTILPAATLNEMWTPGRLSNGKPVELAGIGYGFGWFLERFRGHREVHHGGSTGTCLYRLPDDRPVGDPAHQSRTGGRQRSVRDRAHDRGAGTSRHRNHPGAGHGGRRGREDAAAARRHRSVCEGHARFR